MIEYLPYRGYSLEEIKNVSFIDFVLYYEDGRSIGFSDKKALDYAWKCCFEELGKNHNIFINRNIGR